VLLLSGGKVAEAVLAERLARVRGRPPGPGFRMALHRLRSRRWVVRTGRGGEARLKLTSAGRNLAGLPPAAAAPPPAPDGMMYFVTYDVPNRLNTLRDQFRKMLRSAGWRRLHKSMWVAERDLRHEAAEAAERLGIEPYVFLGLGALVKPLAMTETEAYRRSLRADLKRAVLLARRDTIGAYDLWAQATGRIRQPFGTVHLDAGVRRAWTVACKALRRAATAVEP
jgi:hypothetical protein